MTNPDPSLQKKKRGCFFYGCIISLVLLLLFAGAVGFVVWYGVHTMRGYVAQYTDTSPMQIEKVELPADQLEKLNERIAAFGNAVAAHSNTPPLVLTGPEINAWLSEKIQAMAKTNAAMKSLDGTFFITLEGDEIKGQVSLPLDGLANSAVFRMMNVKGRYLNGAGAFKAAITNGDLFIYVQSLEVKGKPLPPQIMAGLQQQNLAQGVNQQQQNTKALDKFESITVKDSTMVVTPKPN